MLDTETRNKKGIDKLSLSIYFMKLIHSETKKEMTNALDKFYNFIEGEIGRELIHKEKGNFLILILEYSQSEAQTSERMNSIKNIQECNFIIN